MNPNPFVMLIHSRKFWIALADVLGFIGGVLATRYLSPSDVTLVLALGAACQPIIAMLIGAIAAEDNNIRDNAVTAVAGVPAPDMQRMPVSDGGTALFRTDVRR